MNPLAIDGRSHFEIQRIAILMCWLGPRALADYLVQISTPVTVVTMLDVASDYEGRPVDPPIIRELEADRIPPFRLHLVPQDVMDDGAP